MFVGSLSSPGSFANCHWPTNGDPARTAYLKDRIPRYQAVLKSWTRPPNKEEVLAFSQQLFNQGLFFDCHEFLEAFWKSAPEPEKTCLQGLIQIAAGLHKLELDPKATPGALELLGKGGEKLSRSPGLLGAIRTASLTEDLSNLRESLSTNRYKAGEVPPVRWADTSGS